MVFPDDPLYRESVVSRLTNKGIRTRSPRKQRARYNSRTKKSHAQKNGSRTSRRP